LGFFGGYISSEIAERLGLPLGTVKGCPRLGLQGLRDVLPLTGETGFSTSAPLRSDQ
jgi:DNA-directed RNA polymerase specialized sigma24 family protein